MSLMEKGISPAVHHEVSTQDSLDVAKEITRMVPILRGFYKKICAQCDVDTVEPYDVVSHMYGNLSAENLYFTEFFHLPGLLQQKQREQLLYLYDTTCNADGQGVHTPEETTNILEMAYDPMVRQSIIALFVAAHLANPKSTLLRTVPLMLEAHISMLEICHNLDNSNLAASMHAALRGTIQQHR